MGHIFFLRGEMMHMEPNLFADTTNTRLPTTAALSGSLPGPPQGVPLYLGTSSWSSDDWRGTVYPVDANPQNNLAYYAQRFTAVEIDMTFYRIPTPAMVNGWNQRTSAGFRLPRKSRRSSRMKRSCHDVKTSCSNSAILILIFKGPELPVSS